MKNIFRAKAISFKLLFVFVLASTAVFGKKDSLSIVFKADHTDWIYRINEKPRITIVVFNNGKEVENMKLKYQIGPEKMPSFKSDSVTLKNSTFELPAYTMNVGGFLRYVVIAQVNGTSIKSMITAAFSPETITPTIKLPNDFNQFWQTAKESLAKIPVDAKVELIKEYSTDAVNVYQVSLQNINKSRVYGMLSVPKKQGKYPVVLKVPGAGIRPYKGDVALAERGVITFEIGIHGIPVNLEPQVYVNLTNGALNGYPALNLDDKDAFYYKRVYLGCVRALDFLAAHEGYDGRNMLVYGGSQGGALSIVTAALDQRVKYLGVYYPALCDVTGYLNNRAGGWPHYFNTASQQKNNTPKKLETVAYYDVVNFAKQLKVPGFYSWGFNDETCPPTSMYAAYNSIPSPKELAIYKETGHNTVPAQRDKMIEWLLSKMR